MSITALYVYSPTTFKSDTKIEPMTGEPHAAGEVKLSPGIYRVPGSATLVPTNGANASDYHIMPFMALDDTKGHWPDPPQEAMLQLGKSKGEIRAFLSGAGNTNDV